MANLTGKYIENIKTLRESKEEVSGEDIVARTVALAKLIKHEKGIGDLALTVADLIVVDGMSYEEALAEAMKEQKQS